MDRRIRVVCRHTLADLSCIPCFVKVRSIEGGPRCQIPEYKGIQYRQRDVSNNNAPNKLSQRATSAGNTSICLVLWEQRSLLIIGSCFKSSRIPTAPSILVDLVDTRCRQSHDRYGRECQSSRLYLVTKPPSLFLLCLGTRKAFILMIPCLDAGQFGFGVLSGISRVLLDVQTHGAGVGSGRVSVSVVYLDGSMVIESLIPVVPISVEFKK